VIGLQLVVGDQPSAGQEWDRVPASQIECSDALTVSWLAQPLSRRHVRHPATGSR
jgi:hypothetical protein